MKTDTMFDNIISDDNKRYYYQRLRTAHLRNYSDDPEWGGEESKDLLVTIGVPTELPGLWKLDRAFVLSVIDVFGILSMADGCDGIYFIPLTTELCEQLANDFKILAEYMPSAATVTKKLTMSESTDKGGCDDY